MKKEQRKSVKFGNEQPGEAVDAGPKVVAYMAAPQARTLVVEALNDCNSKVKLFTQNDPLIKRKDTAESLITVLENLKFALMHLNLDKQSNYYLAYNGSVQILDICQMLRSANFQSLTIDYLGFAICTVEAHLILINIKFIEWRVKLYVELAKTYEEIGSNEVALKTIELCLKKVAELQAVLEQDPPLPNHTQKIFESVFRCLRVLEIKYKLQLGQLSGDLYKKKLEECFSSDREGKATAVIESLRSKNLNYVEQLGKSLPWKDSAIKQAFEVLKPEITVITDYIKQVLSQIDQEGIDETNEEVRTKLFNDKMNLVLIQESRFREAVKSIPLEYHVELCFHCYDVNNMAIFEELSQSAHMRCKYRRIEVPYITDIKVVVSSHPNPNIPNGYEKIDQDINEAQLKILLKKHRIFKEDQKQNQVKEETTKKDSKKGGKEQKVEKKEENTETKVQEAIPNIKHQYTYVLVKRSISPENAICGFKLVLAPEGNPNSQELKPYIDAGWRVIECPVQQYTGVRETNKMAIFICFKCTEESLKDDEEKKTLLLDIKPVFAKSPLARPDFGYEKIDIDLRQTPKEFIKHPDNDYLYLTFRLDRHFFSNERELKLLMDLHELEKTFGKEKVTAISDIRQLEIDVSYDIQKLNNIFQSIKDSLEGPLGNQFYDERKEFLILLCFFLWKKYMVNQLAQIEHLLDQAIQLEIDAEEMAQYNEHIDPLKLIFKLGLKMINLILVRDPTRSLVWFIKATLELTKILMQDDENHEASQFLKTCYDMVVIYRDEKMTRGVESKRDLFIPYSITASNVKIQDLLSKMMTSYIDFKNDQGCKIREKSRELDMKTNLSPEEQQEELTEILNYKLLVKNDDNKDKAYFEHLPNEQFIPQMDLIIQALQVDLIMCYYRCQIKEGKRQEKAQKISKKTQEMTSDSMMKRLSMNKGKSFLETKQKLNTLQTDLQNAGRLSVPQPQIKDYEKHLKTHASKNPYLSAVLYMLMACNKKQFAEQKYLLQQSLQYIQQCTTMEQSLTENAIKDSVYINSTLLDNGIIPQYSNAFAPFDKLYHPDYIEEQECPRTPILIARSSSSITVKLPPFNPKVNELDYLADPGVKDIRSMVLYGKVSAHGVNVSTTCTDLQNTGVRHQIGSVIQIRGLNQNEGYCFAVAGFNVNEKQSKKIGSTSAEIVTCQPLPINSLYAYLASQAYWIGDYEVCLQAAEACISFFVERSEVVDRSLDQENPVVWYRMKTQALKAVSNIEVSQLAQSLFIKARCLQKIDKKDKKIEKDKALCLQANLSLLALEACAVCNQIIIGKRVLLDLYNNLGEIVKIKSKYLFQILIKMYIFVQEIPKQYWDNAFRQFSAKLIYEISVICFQYNQINLGKLVIYQSTYLPNRKYKASPKIIEVAEDAGQQKVQGGKGAKKEVVQVQATDDVKMVQKVIYTLSESASYQDYLEDALLNFTEEYGDLVAGFLDNWKEQLDFYGQYIDNGSEQIEGIKNQLSLKWNFWEILKEPLTALQKLTTFKNYPSYIEMLCKFARRQIEHNNLKSAKDILNQAEQVTSDSINTLQQIFQIKFECVENDIAWTPERLEILKSEQESNGEIENKAIELFTKYTELTENLKIDTYQTLWRAEFFYLKALTLYLERQTLIKETSPDIYFEMDRLDLDKISIHINEIKELNTKNLSEEDIEFFKDIQKQLAQAAFFSLESKSEFQLKNIIKFSQNINIREQMNPFDVRNSQTNLYSLLIGQCILGIFEKQIPPQNDLQQVLTKDFWFNKAEMQPYADYSSFIINAVLIEEKFSVLSDFCKQFCNVTQHFYSNIVIPFMIHAQTILEEKASNLTKERQDYLDLKTSEYEAWKNSKRRKNRAAMLTGEIPPEEIQYQQDKEVITSQINILKNKQDRITQKKMVASNVLAEIQRDANQAQLMLFECKRLLEKFGEDYKVVEADTSMQQKKPHQLFGQTLTRKYKQVIEMLRKRHDNVGLVRALSQIGDLYFATGQVALAEENWNDALDTIFQKLHSLKNRYQVNMEQNERNCLLACVFLYKLAKHCYYGDFSMQMESLLFVANLSFQVFKTQMVNPQTLIGFADCRNILLPHDLFNENLDPIVTLQACDYLLNGLIDQDLHLKALPLIQIMDYIACHITFSDFYSTRAKLYKSIVLSKIGMMNQAYHLLLQVQNEKCGPISLLQLNENIQLNKGQNWFANSKDFINHMPFFQEQNKDIIEYIQKMELPPNFEQKHSMLNVYLFQFAKVVLLFEIYQQEIIDRPENNEQRSIMIKFLEIKLREQLVIIQKSDDSNETGYQHLGPLNSSEAKEDRLSLMYRTRYVLGNMNLALGFLTKAYFIFKNAILVIQNHMFGYQNAESGKEPENEDQTVAAPTGKDAKKGVKEVKDNKKGPKNVEVVQETEQKMEYLWETLVPNKKRKHLNGFWYVKFKFLITSIYYQQNRYDNCLELVSRLKKDCEMLNDNIIIRSLQEIEGRIAIREGKLDKGIQMIEQCISSLTRFDSQSGLLFGDYGEICFEKNQYEKARSCFQRSHDIFQTIKNEYRFQPIQSINKKPEQEKVKVNEKYLYPSDVMDQLQKKESKIRKDDKRGAKETTKKDTKGKAAVEVVEMKISPLNPLEKMDLTNVPKTVLKDYPGETQQSQSIYVRFLENYLRSCIRLAQCDLALGQNEKVIEALEKIEVYLTSNFNLPQSFKLELNFLQGMAHKRIFVNKVQAYFEPYIQKYLKEKNKKYKKIHDRLPFRDLPRNRYLLDLPNFSNYLKEKLIPDHLEKSKKCFKAASFIIKGECIFFENNQKIDQILIEMSELILLQREYFPRLEFKYIEHEEDERWQRQAYMEKLDKLNLELESFQILNFAMSVHSSRKEILQTSLGNVAIADVSKIPADLVNEILEADFIFKKRYDPLLFDESKNKKTAVTSLDLISLLNKMATESRLMTFSGNKSQKTVQKIHRFLKSYHTLYMQKCMLSSLDITSKADVSVVFIEDGLLKFKSFFCNIEKEHKFIYILSRYNTAKLSTTMAKEDQEKVLLPEDKDVLYGNFYISSAQLSDLESQANNLKSKLQESETKVQTVKERDFRRLNKDYLEIFNTLGKIFCQRSQTGPRKSPVEYDVTQDKCFGFIPSLSVQNVDIFVKMFGPEGLEIENHNLLVIFRNLHRNKYR